MAAVDWKKRGLPYCTVYVITTEDEWPIKIGIAVCPVKRVANLQTAHWKRLMVWAAGWCPTIADARRLERKCHQSATELDLWLLGEWFALKPQKALEMVRFNATIVGVEFNETFPEGDVVAKWEGYRDAIERVLDHRKKPLPIAGLNKSRARG